MEKRDEVGMEGQEPAVQSGTYFFLPLNKSSNSVFDNSYRNKLNLILYSVSVTVSSQCQSASASSSLGQVTAKCPLFSFPYTMLSILYTLCFIYSIIY